MVSLMINGRIRRWWTDSAAGCGGAPLRGRRRHPARGDSDELDAVRPTLKSSEEAPGVVGGAQDRRGPGLRTGPAAGRRRSENGRGDIRHATAQDRGGTDSERVRDDSFSIVQLMLWV
jgi:hypothetical protein